MNIILILVLQLVYVPLLTLRTIFLVKNSTPIVGEIRVNIPLWYLNVTFLYN